jgi:hypothetical protein
VIRREYVADAGGLMLLVSLFVPWYREAGTGRAKPDNVDLLLVEVTTTAWEYFAVLDLVLLAVTFVAGFVPHSGRKTAIAGIVAGALATLLVAYQRFIADPEPLVGEGYNIPLEPSGWMWLALAGSVVVIVGSVLALRRPALTR